MKQYHQYSPIEAQHAMAVLLDQFGGSVDPDFDEGQEEFVRQFAELRMAFDHH